jgi:hypothetical protein
MSKQRGLRFRKMDLHTHTPASQCYEYRDHTAERIVRTAMGKGLDAIAVTDHNTAAWIDRMKAAAEGTSLVVLPGVEISTHEGYHVVALFDTDVGQADVENFLGAIGITPPRYGRSDALCEKGIYDVLDVVHDRGGLAILAHIDEPKGAFHELTTRDAETGKVRVPFPCVNLFNDERYDAVEVTRGRLPDGFDALHNIQRRPPYYQASDARCPENPLHHSDEGLAQRYTWFNLDEIRLEGIRQCFADPEVRICQMDELVERARPHLVRMSVGPVGFLAYQRFHFHPGLNSIIGGKGVGKSLAIEFLRFALDQPSEHSDIRDDHLSKIEARLGAFNSVEVEFKLANGATYVLERTCQGNGESTFKCTNSETGEQYTGSVAHLFPILAYSQTEVIKIAESEGAQLRLLDALIDPRPFQKAIAELQEKLVENNRLVAEALDARVRTDECRGEIATLQEEIKNIDRLLSAAFLAQMKSAEAKRESFDQQSAYLDGLLALGQEYAEKVGAREPAPVPEELADDPALQSQYARSRAARQYVLDTLAAIGDRLREERDAVCAAKSEWMPEFEAIREEYEQELCGSDHAQLEAQRRRLVKHVAQVERDLERHRKQAEEDLPRLLQRRAALLDRLDQEHLAYFELRRKKFDGLTQASNGRLRLTLAHAANRAGYTEALVDLLKGRSASTISVAHRRKITARLSPRELGDVIITHDVKALAKGTGLNLEMAERAMSKLWGHDDFTGVLAIQHAYYPEDTPSIQFNKGHGEYADLSELSVGQKCTALLIIALCDGDMPVIIDQPEDALDIASVWEDIAKKLRRGKYSRQFILTTHNSSLAVGSDSDEFMVLTPLSADRAKVSYRGAIDRSDVRQAVIDHLEGGPEPYKLRQRKYNIR